MRVLIAGGASTLGLILSRALLNAGHEVICVDDLRSGSLDGIHALQDQPGFNFICRDAREGVLCVPEVVIHLIRLGLDEHQSTVGASPGLDEFMMSADLAMKTGARLLLVRLLDSFEAAVKGRALSDKPSWFGQDNVDVQEKCLIMALGLKHHRGYQMDLRIARIYNLYGLNSSSGLDALIARAQLGIAVKIQNPEWDHWFCHKDDVVGGLLRLALSKLPSETPICFDFACAERVQARTAGWMVGSVFGTKVREETTSLPQPTCGPKLDAAFHWLDWYAVTRFAQGLTSTIVLLK